MVHTTYKLKVCFVNRFKEHTFRTLRVEMWVKIKMLKVFNRLYWKRCTKQEEDR